MPSLFLPKDALPGDRNRQYAGYALLLCLAATPLSVWLFLELGFLWQFVLPLEGTSFILGATVFGAVLAITPVLAVLGFLLAIWFGVESVYLARSRPRLWVDRIIVGFGLITWFLPALGFLATAIRAIFTGGVHFSRPARDYLLAEDPIAYLEGVGFLFIMAGLFAWGAWRYWQGKLGRKADT
jgi:hypothetical protein